MHLTQELELFPDRSVTQLLFKDVKNATELRRCAMEGKINGALINPTMVSMFSHLIMPLCVCMCVCVRVYARARVCYGGGGEFIHMHALFLSQLINELANFFIVIVFLQLVDPFQLLVAANKAVHLQKIGKMKTRSLYSEIIFNLSPTNNISEAFKRFGISDGDDSVLVVLVHTKDESQLLTDITTKVDGQQIPVEEISALSDSTKIKKLYKVTSQEEKCGTLLDAVVCRMATKDVM
ncbi:LOW QUALITY PROTEIN: EKC/KEOPS complex subunit TPRKB [Polymixia lowei]